MSETFLFRDGLKRVFKVVWDGVDSILYAHLRGGHWFQLRNVKPMELEAFMENELLPEEYSKYDLRVSPIGRLFFMVASSSRPDVAHVVDLESSVYSQSPACSCEHAQFRKCECAHLRAVREFIGLNTQSRHAVENQQARGISTPLRPICLAA